SVTPPTGVLKLRLRSGDQDSRLSDIATVTVGLEEPFQRKFRFNGQESVEIGVVMADGFNVTDVGKAVNETYQRFTQTLPIGASIDQISNQTEVVTESAGAVI